MGLQTTSFSGGSSILSKLVFDLSASHKNMNGLFMAVFVEPLIAAQFAGIYQHVL